MVKSLLAVILVVHLGTAFAAKESLTLEVNTIILEQPSQKGDRLVAELQGVDWAHGVKKWVVSQI